MLEKPQHAKHFDYWYSTAHLADDFGVPIGTANAWISRGFIPKSRNSQRYKIIKRKHGEAHANVFWATVNDEDVDPDLAIS